MLPEVERKAVAGCHALAFLGAAAAVLIGLCINVAAAAESIATGAAAWRELTSPGAVALIRHARTSAGTGDPPGFKLEDCATQRNLTDPGRTQSAALGQRFRAKGVAVELVLSSRWCRCLETARIAFGGAEPWPPLDNIWDDRSREPAQSAEVRKRIKAWARPGALALVTHGVNIAALTGITPVEGEVVVLKPDPAGDFKVVGRIGPND